MECRPTLCGPGVLFCAFPEFHTYQRWWTLDAIVEAIQNRGCRAVIGPIEMPAVGFPALRIANPNPLCARLAQAFFQRSGGPLPVIGVTGTNGKTTTVKLVAHLLNAAGTKAADLGTLGTCFGGKIVFAGEYTTDLAVELHRKLGALESMGARMAVMEVSSHALALQRVSAVHYAAAVLTNLTRDHLDFHGTVDRYRSAKRRLFEGLKPDGLAILNADDPAAPEFAGATAGRVVTFGEARWADLRLNEARFTASGTQFSVEWRGAMGNGFTPLVGAFQLHNVLAGMATVLGLGADLGQTLEGVRGFHAVAGRMEQIALPSGAVVVIDYAHNPDGLQHVLRSCRALNPRRLRVVFGCGGDRDRGKRPQMGAIAEQWCADGWVTSDNPRTEDPQAILDDILRGMRSRGRFSAILDRTQAITSALNESAEGDVIVIAGKGHEDYQIVGTEKRPYSDHSVVRRWLADRS